MPTRLLKNCLIFSLLSIFALPMSVFGDEQTLDLDISSLREAGYKLNWINHTKSKDLRLGTIQDDSFYAIDQEDFLNRFDITSGKWLWSAPIGNQIFDLHSISQSETENLVYVLSDSVIYVVEQSTGNRPTQDKKTKHTPRHQMKLNRLATSPAVNHDGSLIYGSSSGDTIWFDPTIGFTQHRYKAGGSIYVQPVYVASEPDSDGRRESAIVSVSSDGHVTAVDTNTIRQLWEEQLLDSVETPVTSMTIPSNANQESVTLVLIAGTDQYLRAIDLTSGLTKWKTLTTAPLVDTPFTTADSVYQRIPNVGLAKFKAIPTSITGDRVWLNGKITGNVVATNRLNQLVVWDAHSRELQIVDPSLGGVIATASLPSINSLQANESGDLYAITDSNYLICLSPRR